MIPANIDIVAIIKDLNAWGLGDRKIEMICGFADGHITHIKAGRKGELGYSRAARLYNFWWEECKLHGKLIPWGDGAASADWSQHMAATT